MNDFPWLTALIVVPLVGAVVTAALPYEGDKSRPKKIALGFSVLTLVLGYLAFREQIDRRLPWSREVTGAPVEAQPAMAG